MKLIFGFGVIALLVVQVLSKNLPLKSRTFGNFQPQLKRSFQIFKTHEQIVVNADDAVASALGFAKSQTSSALQMQITNFHTSEHNKVTHVYLQQSVNGIPVVNGVGNVNVGQKGQILSFGNSFYTGTIPKFIQPKITVTDAHMSLNTLLGKSATTKLSEEFPAKLAYIQVNNGKDLVLAWNIVVETERNLYNAIVDATTSEVALLMDWISDASYNVYPLGVNDPSSGDRVIVHDPANSISSRLGWHAQTDDEVSTLTIGNNVYAQENLDGGDDYIDNHRPDGGEALHFDNPLDLTQHPVEYIDAAITNLFYWNNVIHDVFYLYGFNEVSGNFQQNNFGNGGAGNDPVIANAQDGIMTDNAFFSTPPDGESGRMWMFVWTAANPDRDSDLDNGIIVHEYLHGISIRLTGGPSNVGCLGSGEPGGMGEGWGDVFGTILRVNSNTTRNTVFEMGAYANGGSGIRKFPYSTNMETNPSTYSYVTRPEYNGVHAKGEVWAVILFEVFWNVVEKHGFDPDWYNSNANDVKTEGTYKSIVNGQELPRPQRNATLGGNNIFFQLLIDGMKIQPCDPTFVDARDAIIQADEINNGGENACEIWSGFAKRGLGVGAEFEGVEDFEVPSECQ